MIELLGALAAGYAWAMRDHVLTQQQEVTQALSLARQDIEQDLHLLRQRLSHQTLHDLRPVCRTGYIRQSPGDSAGAA